MRTAAGVYALCICVFVCDVTRAAAARCRNKKKQWVTNLEKKAEDMQALNARLQVRLAGACCNAHAYTAAVMFGYHVVGVYTVFVCIYMYFDVIQKVVEFFC